MFKMGDPVSNGEESMRPVYFLGLVFQTNPKRNIYLKANHLLSNYASI